MSVLENQPQNLNFLSPLNYKFVVKKMPHVNFFLQKVNTPAINLPPVPAGNPFVNIHHAGDHIQFGNLNLTFKVDERMKNYQEIYNWIMGLGFPQSFDQYRDLENEGKQLGYGIKSDCSVTVLDSAKNPRVEFIYVDTFPTFLSELQFDTTMNDVQFVTASAIFKYTYFKINTAL